MASPERRWWERALARVDALLPAQYRDDTEASARARLLNRALVAVVGFAGVMTLQYLPTGLWGQVGLNGFVCVAGVLMLWGLRRGAALDVVLQWALGVPSTAFALGSLAQTPFDVSSVFFLAVTPLLASFVLGWRWALVWLVAMSALGSLMLYLGFHGYVLPQVDATPQLTQLVNFAYLMLIVALIGIGVHEVRSHAFRAADLASRAKSAFLANMSHEIRTPMNGVLGLTEVMLREPLEPRQRERLELIRRSGEMLVSLINDVLDLARIEAGKFVLSKQPVALSSLVSDVHSLFASTATAKGITLELELSRDVPAWVSTDATRLRQILFNLVSNAVKFTPKGRVKLRIEQTARATAFHVEDSGIGMSSNTLAKLFTVFEQGDSSTTRRYGGSGLGLALSRQLVELLGGTLEVESVERQGTHFWFSLQLEPCAPAVDTAHTETELPLARAIDGRVLVVDDNAINLKVAASLVARAGYDVTTASNGREAVEVVRQGGVSLVLMDCHMPEMDGFEATRQIRTLPTGASLGIIALTASTFPEDVAACMAAGMNECLAKPVSLDSLAKVMARVLEPKG